MRRVAGSGPRRLLLLSGTFASLVLPATMLPTAARRPASHAAPFADQLHDTIPHLADSQVDTVRRGDDHTAVIVEKAEILEFVRVVAADAAA